MLETIASVDTRHEDMIHDAQLDFFGKRLATASSDRTIRIFDVVGDKHTFVTELKGHEGPVWQVAWAHPKYGNILASCSYDRKVIIWRESAGQWVKAYEYAGHTSSVNSICWAPPEYASLLGDDVGLVLACASSDGFVSILTNNESGWEPEKFHAHDIGCNAVSWAPAFNAFAGSDSNGAAAAAAPAKRRLVTGGCDSNVKIWQLRDGKWILEGNLPQAHTDWVRDVCWAPNIGLPVNVVASCGQDKRVVICTESREGEWKSKELPVFPDVVWRVSWSVTGDILAVSGGDGKASLWKEDLDGNWACISEMDDAASNASAADAH
ncbi:protein transporter SEC13 [Capsaspora owczarzaki ATCC 30864]|uniref:Protein transporter SEC13 n=1 Tax=Capsaspora owczarzaki (strain ATCC 30864) TaxID=595528 RepID=A0A0D2WIS8_CAPO3|nr:protein transporter SEC13 [Capsaspora owczarzaki ATCC 30864]KJE89028.1 protein transporter SEC13 [Capsaspora owczarzaki ATCC 30864]|eukprot:XP_004365458.2 protein transporter SEC13 [Capsaspora owczarzaki ATCC 30864]